MINNNIIDTSTSCNSDINQYVIAANNCSTQGNEQPYTDINLLNTIWNEKYNCPLAYEVFMNSTPKGSICSLQYNEANSCILKKYVSYIFTTFTQNCQIGDVNGSTACKEFEIKLQNLCLNLSLPGVCSYFLSGNATGCEPSITFPKLIDFCNKYTREEVLDNKSLTSFCGCYVEPDKRFIDNIWVTPGCLNNNPEEKCEKCPPNDREGCVNNPTCDSLCHRANTSQRATVNNGKFITCPQNICAINDVTIDIINSVIGGGINFNSICGGCDKNNGCLCVISGLNINQTMSNIGVGNLNNLCETSYCINEKDEIQDCGDFNPKNGAIPFLNYSVNIGIAFILLVTILIVLFICIAVRFNHKK
jgi:hypothetical protein